jgi:hypothetical protein
MPFPLSRRGEIHCNPASSVAVVLVGISEELRKAELQNVQVCGDCVYFGGTASKGRRIYMGLIKEGEVKISRRGGGLAVSYSLRFRGLLMVTVVSAVMGFGLFDLTTGMLSFPPPLFWIAVLWWLTMVGDYVQTSFDFASLMRRALEGV